MRHKTHILHGLSSLAAMLMLHAATPAAAQEREVVVRVPGGMEVEMIWVEGGSFTMGCDRPADVGRKYDAYRPEHRVEVSGFYMARLEVTQALWEAVMGSNPSHFEGNDSLPVEQVSWDDAQRFAATLSSLTGHAFRLPTEAEWEYAARGGNRSQGLPYPGSSRSRLEEAAWYCVNSANRTHPVGRLAPNELGLHDMGGNVAEWCADYYADYTAAPATDPRGPREGESRVVRGGNWGSISAGCAVFDRGWYVPTGKTEYYGLRLAMDPLEDPE